MDPSVTRNSVPEGLAYISDFNNSAVYVFGRRSGTLLGVIANLGNPEGLFVDAHHNLWVANEGDSTGITNVEVFRRGSILPKRVLTSTNYPDDVTVCPNGTAYVSDFLDTANGQANIDVFAPGSNTATGSLEDPYEHQNYFVTCDAQNNVFTDFVNGSGGYVDEYVGGAQAGMTRLPIVLQRDPYGESFPGGIKVDAAGNLLVNDQLTRKITEYTEAGAPTGHVLPTTDGDIVDIAVSSRGHQILGADAKLLDGQVWKFPGGSPLRQYSAAFSLPIGAAFDPPLVP